VPKVRKRGPALAGRAATFSSLPLARLVRLAAQIRTVHLKGEGGKEYMIVVRLTVQPIEYCKPGGGLTPPRRRS
jgi:hypothetical protein